MTQMIKWIDEAGRKRGLEVCNSYNPKYALLTQWVDKRDYGQAVQIPVEKVDELISNLTNLKKE